jgi:hypothetical protein
MTGGFASRFRKTEFVAEIRRSAIKLEMKSLSLSLADAL